MSHHVLFRSHHSHVWLAWPVVAGKKERLEHKRMILREFRIMRVEVKTGDNDDGESWWILMKADDDASPS